MKVLKKETLEAFADELRAKGTKMYTCVVDSSNRQLVQSLISNLVKEAGKLPHT